MKIINRLKIATIDTQRFSLTESSWAILALMRFLLATVVYISHMHIFTSMPLPFQKISIFGGRAAVLGFLLISGISIGYSYCKSKNGYLTRRFLRIYPLYFFSVLFTILLQYFLGSPYHLPGQTMAAAGWPTSVANFFFLQGFASITITYNVSLWSLGVEVFLYLLVPFLMRVPLKLIYLILITSMSVLTISGVDFLYGYPVLVWAWPWLIGFSISARQSMKYTFLFLILGAIVVIINKNIFPANLSWFTFSIVSLVVLITRYKDLKLPQLLIRFFNYLGEISYPLYLLHFPIYLILFYFGIRNAYLFCLLLLLSIIPLNYLFDHWLKRVFWKPLVEFMRSIKNYYGIDLFKKIGAIFHPRNILRE